MDKKLHSLMLVLTILVVTSFFMPWVKVQSQQIGAVSKLLTGKRQADIDSISGIGVPIRANGEDARLIISVMKIFSPKIKDADKKSFLVLLVPILALAMFLGYRYKGDNKLVLLLIATIGISIFTVGTFKIVTTDMDKLVLNIKIGSGLWTTFVAYLGMGLTGLAGFIFKIKK